VALVRSKPAAEAKNKSPPVDTLKLAKTKSKFSPQRQTKLKLTNVDDQFGATTSQISAKCTSVPK
jgi:hypothetical protein